MKRFVKPHGENAWLNLLGVDIIAFRPQRKAAGRVTWRAQNDMHPPACAK